MNEYLITCFLSIILFGSQFFPSKFTNQSETCIKIKNNTGYDLKDVSIFSKSFYSIDMNKESNFKRIKYVKLETNDVLKLNALDKNFEIYVSFESGNNKVLYVIDSLNFKTRYIHYSIIKE